MTPEFLLVVALTCQCDLGPPIRYTLAAPSYAACEDLKARQEAHAKESGCEVKTAECRATAGAVASQE